jgi:hypothetical protein
VLPPFAKEVLETAKLEADVLIGEWSPLLVPELPDGKFWASGEGGESPLSVERVGEGQPVGLFRGTGGAGTAFLAASR